MKTRSKSCKSSKRKFNGKKPSIVSSSGVSSSRGARTGGRMRLSQLSLAPESTLCLSANGDTETGLLVHRRSSRSQTRRLEQQQRDSLDSTLIIAQPAPRALPRIRSRRGLSRASTVSDVLLKSLCSPSAAPETTATFNRSVSAPSGSGVLARPRIVARRRRRLMAADNIQAKSLSTVLLDSSDQPLEHCNELTNEASSHDVPCLIQTPVTEYSSHEKHRNNTTNKSSPNISCSSKPPTQCETQSASEHEVSETASASCSPCLADNTLTQLASSASISQAEKINQQDSISEFEQSNNDSKKATPASSAEPSTQCSLQSASQHNIRDVSEASPASSAKPSAQCSLQSASQHNIRDVSEASPASSAKPSAQCSLQSASQHNIRDVSEASPASSAKPSAQCSLQSASQHNIRDVSEASPASSAKHSTQYSCHSASQHYIRDVSRASPASFAEPSTQCSLQSASQHNIRDVSEASPASSAKPSAQCSLQSASQHNIRDVSEASPASSAKPSAQCSLQSASQHNIRDVSEASPASSAKHSTQYSCHSASQHYIRDVSRASPASFAEPSTQCSLQSASQHNIRDVSEATPGSRSFTEPCSQHGHHQSQAQHNILDASASGFLTESSNKLHMKSVAVQRSGENNDSVAGCLSEPSIQYSSLTDRNNDETKEVFSDCRSADETPNLPANQPEHNITETFKALPISHSHTEPTVEYGCQSVSQSCSAVTYRASPVKSGPAKTPIQLEARIKRNKNETFEASPGSSFLLETPTPIQLGISSAFNINEVNQSSVRSVYVAETPIQRRLLLGRSNDTYDASSGSRRIAVTSTHHAGQSALLPNNGESLDQSPCEHSNKIQIASHHSRCFPEASTQTVAQTEKNCDKSIKLSSGRLCPTEPLVQLSQLSDGNDGTKAVPHTIHCLTESSIQPEQNNKSCNPVSDSCCFAESSTLHRLSCKSEHKEAETDKASYHPELKNKTLEHSDGSCGFVTVSQATLTDDEIRQRLIKSVCPSSSSRPDDEKLLSVTADSNSDAYLTMAQTTVTDDEIRQQLIKSVCPSSSSRPDDEKLLSVTADSNSDAYLTMAQTTVTDDEIRQQLIKSVCPSSSSRPDDEKLPSITADSDSDTYLTMTQTTVTDNEIRQQLIKSVHRTTNPRLVGEQWSSDSNEYLTTFQITLNDDVIRQQLIRSVRRPASTSRLANELLSYTSSASGSDSYSTVSQVTIRDQEIRKRLIRSVRHCSSAGNPRKDIDGSTFVTEAEFTEVDSLVRKQHLPSLRASRMYTTIESEATVDESSVRRHHIPSVVAAQSSATDTDSAFETVCQVSVNETANRAQYLPSILPGSDTDAFATLSETTMSDDELRQKWIHSVRPPAAPSQIEGELENDGTFVTEAEFTETNSYVRQRHLPSLRQSRMYATVSSEATAQDSSLRRQLIPSVRLEVSDSASASKNVKSPAKNSRLQSRAVESVYILPSILAASGSHLYETVSETSVSDDEVRRRFLASKATVEVPTTEDAAMLVSKQLTAATTAAPEALSDCTNQPELDHAIVIADASPPKRRRRRRASAADATVDSSYFYDPHNFLTREAKARRISIAPHLLPLACFDFFCDERGLEFDLATLQQVALITKDVEEHRLANEAAVAKSARWSRRIRNNPPMRLKPTSNVRIFGYLSHPVRRMDRVLIGLLEPAEYDKLRRLILEKSAATVTS